MAKRKKQTKSKSPYFFKTLLIIGLSLMFFAGVMKVNANSNLFFTRDIPVKEVDLITANPSRIEINSAGINLNIFETRIVNKNWEINEDGASHLDTSANPGEGGNIIIYAHNTSDRFGNLRNVKTGDIIIVSSKNNKVYSYEVKKINIVDPTDASLLLPTKKELLTIYTCTGFADLKRLVIQATPIN